MVKCVQERSSDFCAAVMCYYCLVSLPYDNRWLAFREEELLPEMWFQFAFSLGVFLFVLALPGFCFFRLLETNRLHALLLSPAFSLTLYSGLGVLYGFAGIASSALTVFLIPCTLLLACLALKRLRGAQRRKRGEAPTSCGTLPADWLRARSFSSSPSMALVHSSQPMTTYITTTPCAH